MTSCRSFFMELHHRSTHFETELSCVIDIILISSALPSRVIRHCHLHNYCTVSYQKKYKRFSEHIGRFPIIIISPTDTNLILEGSETRRKYIDTSISLYEKPYLQLLIQRSQVWKEKVTLRPHHFGN